ncbi:MAG: RidA family protein [Verrucomicrobiae bacterium]|nr:RidA family protein [Verrucomicrobiae bacterium]
MLKYVTPSDIVPPFANYSHGVEVPATARLIFCSGQLSVGPDGEIPDGTEAQARLIFKNIEAILRDAGMTLKNIVRINAFVTGREHLQPYMKVRDELFSQPAPASTLMIVSGFTREAFTVEIEVIAAAES